MITASKLIYQLFMQYVVFYIQIGPSLESLKFLQRNHEKYRKFCVYWLGPFIPMVFTADLEILKALLQLPGGMVILNTIVLKLL